MTIAGMGRALAGPQRDGHTRGTKARGERGHRWILRYPYPLAQRGDDRIMDRHIVQYGEPGAASNRQRGGCMWQ
jgi:hypothetical protein